MLCNRSRLPWCAHDNLLSCWCSRSAAKVGRLPGQSLPEQSDVLGSTSQLCIARPELRQGRDGSLLLCVTDCLKDLQRFLRQDDPETRPTFTALSKFDVAKSDLVPAIVANPGDTDLVYNACKLPTAAGWHPEHCCANSATHQTKDAPTAPTSLWCPCSKGSDLPHNATGTGEQRPGLSGRQIDILSSSADRHSRVAGC